MLANFLDKSKPINFIVLLSLFFIVFSFYAYELYFDTKFSFGNVTDIGILLTLFISIFFFFNFIVAKNNLTFDNSYAYFIFTLLLISVLPEVFSINFLTGYLIYLLFLRKVYSFYSSKKIIKKLFDSGFWLSILFLISPNSIVFILLIYLSIFLYQKITIHTLLTPLIGFIAPIIIYFSYSYWYNNPQKIMSLFNLDFDANTSIYFEGNFSILLLFIILLTFASLTIKSPKVLGVNNTFRKSWILLFLHLIVIAITLILINNNRAYIAYIFFPVSIIIANGLELISNKIIKNSILLTLLFGVLVFRFIL